MVDSSISPQGKETMLLAELGALRTGVGRVQEALGLSVHLIKTPMTARLFPIVMVMGMMILIAALVVDIVDAAIALALSRSPSPSAAGPSCGREFLGDKGPLVT